MNKSLRSKIVIFGLKNLNWSLPLEQVIKRLRLGRGNYRYWSKLDFSPFSSWGDTTWSPIFHILIWCLLLFPQFSQIWILFLLYPAYTKEKKNRPNVSNLNQLILIGHELKITLRRRMIKDELRSARECFSPEWPKLE